MLEPDNPDYVWKRGRSLIYLTGSQTTDQEKAATLSDVITTLEATESSLKKENFANAPKTSPTMIPVKIAMNMPLAP